MALSIAVVIPLYNRAHTIAEAIESVLAQQYAAREVIVVDDGSTDASLEIARQFPVRIVALPQNQGVSAARNAGIAVTSSDIVAFLDSDDRWLPDHLQTLVELFENSPDASAAYTRMQSFGVSDQVWRHTIPPGQSRDCYWDLVDSMIVPLSASAVRKSMLDAHGAFDPTYRHSEDYELYLRLSRHGRFVCSDEITVEYRLHEDQLTKSDGRIILGVWRARMTERKRLASSDPAAIQKFDAIARQHLTADVWNLVHSGDPRSVAELRNLIGGESAFSLPVRSWIMCWTLAHIRNTSRSLPSPLRNVGRRIARLIPR